LRKLFLAVLVFSWLLSAGRGFCQDANPPIYSEIIPTSSGLPYDPATDIRESFEAPNGKTVEVLVKGPVGSGTYTRAIRPGETPDEYFPAVVAEAVEAKAHHLVIPKGVYAFHGPELCTDLESPSCNQSKSCNVNQPSNCQAHWTIGQYPQGQVIEPDSVSDLDIDFSGSELDFSAPVRGIWILEAQRLRLRNFTVDWPSLPIASLGTIVRDPDNPGHNALVLDAGYPVKDKYRGGSVQIQAVDLWDSSSKPSESPGVIDPNSYIETYFIFDNAPQPTYVGGHTFSCESCNFVNSPTDPTCNNFQGCANFDIFPVGSRVIARHYTYNQFAIWVTWSNDIDFENVKLRTSPGNGFEVSNEGGYRGFRIANSEFTRGPGRIISIASGSIDLGLQADVILEGNNIGYQGDDGIAIHANTVPVLSAQGTQVTLAGICDPDPMDQPIAGDTLAFYDENSAYKGSARVVTSVGAFCSNTLLLTMDHAVAGLGSSDSFLDLTQQPMARFIVRDNVLHDNRGHGVLANANYGSIDHNSIYHNSFGAIALNAGFGTQSAGATNLAISDNAVSHPGTVAQDYGAFSLTAFNAAGSTVAAPVFDKIKIQNNSIENTPGPAIIATSARNFSIDLNWIFSSNQTQTLPTNYGTLSTLDSILIYQSSDGTVCDPYRAGATTGPIGIDPTDDRVSVESNCALYGGR
jgi:hypothetical protein